MEKINEYLIPKANDKVQQPHLTKIDEIVEIEDFDFSNYQVVRREFFSHLREPSIIFNHCQLLVNTACVRRFPNANFAQVLINRQQKILALRPCEEYTRDCFPWCKEYKGKRVARPTTCKLFYAKIFDMMQWIPDFKYKLLGKVIHSNGEYLLAFDLTATEVYPNTKNKRGNIVSTKQPVFPKDWQNQFGLPYYEHKQSMQVNVFDGYAIYTVKETIEEKPNE